MESIKHVLVDATMALKLLKKCCYLCNETLMRMFPVKRISFVVNTVYLY